MRRTPHIPPIVLLAAALLLSAWTPPAGAAETRAQKFFSKELQAERKAGANVRRNLRDGTWRVDRDIVFADLTGDGKSDAVVRVYSGTAAQDVAVYVFSSKEGEKLRVVFLKERLYRVTVSTQGGLLRLSVPSFEAGSPTCCPRNYLQRAYRWRDDHFVLVSTQRTSARVPGAGTS